MQNEKTLNITKKGTNQKFKWMEEETYIAIFPHSSTTSTDGQFPILSIPSWYNCLQSGYNNLSYLYWCFDDLFEGASFLRMILFTDQGTIILNSECSVNFISQFVVYKLNTIVMLLLHPYYLYGSL